MAPGSGLPFRRSAPPAAETWRRLALSLLLLGMAGVGLELVLLEHYEDAWQWVPLVLLGAGVLVGGAAAVRPGRSTVGALRALMLVYLVAAFLGIFLHYQSNVEFERELRPSMAGAELILEALRGAMPVLAPGALAWLGLLGLLATYRHPSFGGPTVPDAGPAQGRSHDA